MERRVVTVEGLVQGVGFRPYVYELAVRLALGGHVQNQAGGRQAIEAAVARYVTATNEGDSEALTALYAEDAVLLPPDHEAIEGREAIGAFWRQGTDEGLEVRTLRIDNETFLKLVTENAHVALHVMKQLSDKIANTTRLVERLQRELRRHGPGVD